MNVEIRTGTMPLEVSPSMLMADPHKALAQLRAEHALVSIGSGQCLVRRAKDVLALLTDQKTRQVEGAEFVAINRIPEGVTARFLSDFFLFSNGDVHRSRRGLFARRFAHRVMQDSRPIACAAAKRIFADLPRGKTFDFVDRVAARIPAEMIAGLLGLPAEEAREFTAWVYDVALALSSFYPHERHEAIEDATRNLHAYVAGHLNARLAAPRDDFLSALATDWNEEPTISFDSLVFQVMGIIIGGSDTTRAAFAILTALLLEDPGRWAALREDRTLIPGAVSEALRYEPSVATIPRLLTEDMRIGGIELPAGSAVRLSTMSALRDPDLYADPDRFDIHRSDHPRLHLVFGLGPHRCIGEMLARVELEESLAALLDFAPDMIMERMPKMLGFAGIRQINPMPVRIGQ